MKTLYLLRHAQALPSQNGSDMDRALSPKGLEDALALGGAMAKKGFIPARIACSAAKRTQQTCAQVLSGMEREVHTEFSKVIYTASFGDLLHIVQNTDDAHDSLMIVGHNPTIYEMAVRLAGNGPETVMNGLAEGGYAPATLSVINVDTPRWAEINPAHCAITALLDPIDYNGSERPTRWM